MKLKAIPSNGLILFLMGISTAAGIPVYEEDAQESSRVGRQGILEIPKQFATIIREALSEGIVRLLSTTSAPTFAPPTTVKPKIQQQVSNAVEVTTKKAVVAAPTKKVDSFLDEFLSNNFLSNYEAEEARIPATFIPKVPLSTLSPNRPRTTPESKVVTSTSPPTSSFSVVANAFPSDFDDGIISVDTIISTPAPTIRPTAAAVLAVRQTPSPPVVVTPDEEIESTTVEVFEEEETTTEAAETTEATTEEEEETTTEAPSTTADSDDDGGEDEGDEEETK